MSRWRLKGNVVHVSASSNPHASDAHLRKQHLVALEDLGEELHLADAGDADVAGDRGVPASEVAVTLAETPLGALTELGLKLSVFLLSMSCSRTLLMAPRTRSSSEAVAAWLRLLWVITGLDG